MKIYSMTATFGKLENKTLTLTPGLNVIEAPNEWGKSTWCAFLVAMLYGIDTRERTTADALADKERYAPWSGSPMSGRIELCWNGRDITIERSTKGRSVFGKFIAYETSTGLEVPELTAANCGQMLLGVEKSVFLRAGFLKLTDLPVTQDESLRRRLNALVTTGDESGASDDLAQKLKELKNQIRTNRANGLIPKAEAQKQDLEEKLTRLTRLREQSVRLQQRQKEVSDFTKKLQNHKAALDYAAADMIRQKANIAKIRLDSANAKVSELEETCAQLPTRQVLEKSLGELQELRRQRESVQMEAQMLPPAPERPEAPAPFHGLSPEEAVTQAREDCAKFRALVAPKTSRTAALGIVGLCLIAAGIAALFFNLILGIIVLALGAVVLAAEVLRRTKAKQEAAQAQSQAAFLKERYRMMDPHRWENAAEEYAERQQSYERQMEVYSQKRSELKEKMDQVNARMEQCTGGISYLQAEQQWLKALEQRKALSEALLEQQRAMDMVQAFTVDQSAPAKPEMPDELTYDTNETARLLADTMQEYRMLEHQAGQVQGQMNTLGDEGDLQKQLQAVCQRLAKLEETYKALELALKTLDAASAELQRRFAPRISQRSKDLFSRLTGARYDRLTLGEDLSLRAGAEGETTLHTAMWRSDGTIDQLYLALRLAVAEELTPDAPLVLDDALVRFDDTRLAEAMRILQEYAENKQVILFTCQHREKSLL